MRPSDFGVMWQIYRLCIYQGQLPAAADALAAYRPSGHVETREWLRIRLDSHVSGFRMELAVETANQLLRIDPKNEKARQFLR